MPARTLAEIERERREAGARKRAHWALLRLRRRIENAPHRARVDLMCAWQRLTRGWDVRSVWSLDDDLSGRLGAQLLHMADIAHGWPGEQYGTFDDWVRDLRRAGWALLRYRELHHEDFTDQGIRGDAKSALYWVADNLGALWD